MSLLKAISGVLKPKWQHHNHNVRIKAIARLPKDNSAILTEIVLHDPAEEAQIVACKKIIAINQLINIAELHDNLKIRNLAQKKYDNLVYDKLINTSADENGNELIKSVKSQRVLADIVLNGKCEEFRKIAFNRIDSEEIFYRIAVAESCSKEFADVTVSAISDKKMLTALTRKGISKAVKKRANQRLEQLYPLEENSQLKQQEQTRKLHTMVKYAESACRISHNLDGIARILETEKKCWLTLDPKCSHELAERFFNALDMFTAHYNVMIAEHQTELLEQEQEHKQCMQQEELFNQLKALDCQQENATEQLIVLKTQWAEFIQSVAGLTVNKLQQQFTKESNQLETDIRDAAMEKEQLQQLLEDCAEAEAILKSENIDDLQKYSFPIWQKSQFKFINHLAQFDRFAQVKNALEDKLKMHKQTTETAEKERLEKLESLLCALQLSVDAEDRRNAAKELRVIKTEWQALGGNKLLLLAQKFSKLEDDFHVNQQEFTEECKWNEWANKNLKTELIRTVEQTATNTDLEQVATIIRTAQQRWKKTGAAPRAVNDELWQRFHQVCEENYSRCQELFKQKEQARIANLEYCRKLCKAAEELCNTDDFHNAAKQFKTLNRDWKAHSNLPKNESEDLYKRFRGFTDRFFERLNAYYLEIDNQREEHQKIKESLIAKVEALCTQDNLPTAPCIALQKKWKTLGPGMRDQETENIRRFRTACDKFFALVEQEREKNIPAKEQICDNIEALLVDEHALVHEQIIEKITILQKNWKQLGPTPKNNQELKKRFQTAGEKLLGIKRSNAADATVSLHENIELKKQFSEQAETLAISTNWKASTAQFKELQAKWTIIGQIPGENSAELWHRFRNACNTFFDRRKEYFSTMDAQRQHNFKEKEALIARLENITASLNNNDIATVSASKLTLAEQIQLSVENNFALSDLDGRDLVDAVKRIQQNWKNIGPVPHEYNNDLWEKYRNLIDHFYNACKKEQ
jgi:Domain of Unknown Function (DUF349)